ncbi:Uncharacterised protein [Mycobacteroides abscessus subsp. abscessus]|nr:Uncharacterised protein [Mycobacteroides abscessus subsp. abscessus]
MAGTNCTALAPVPITATRLPVRSASWSHSAEWKASAGRESWPTAEISTAQVYSVPSAVRTRQRPVASSYSASVTSLRKRIFGSRLLSRAIPRR